MLINNNIVEDVLLPLFNELQEQNIISCIYNIHGQILKSTAKRKQLFADEAFSNIVPDYPGFDRDSWIEVDLRLAKLKNLVIKNKVVLCVIALLPFPDRHNSYIFTYLPVLHQGNVIAVQEIAQEIDLSPLLSFSTQICSVELKEDKLVAQSSLKIKLSKRQAEILFLISSGFAQHVVAEMLGIKRGSVAKIISDHLCPKFAIEKSDTKLLAKLARDLGIHNIMPKGLLKPQLIVLNYFEQNNSLNVNI